MGPGGHGPGGGRWRDNAPDPLGMGGGGDWAGRIAQGMGGVVSGDRVSADLAGVIRQGGAGTGRGRLVPLHAKGKMATLEPDAKDDLYQTREYTTLGIIEQRDGRYHALRPAIQHLSTQQQRDRGESFDTEDQAHDYLYQFGQTDRGRRERYNQAMLAEALGYAADNEEDDEEPDDELEAQVELIEAARARGDDQAWDSAIDHLRTMLLISYADEEDLPEAPEA